MSDVTLYPTLPGKAPGIVGYDPLKMQCGDCGAIHEQCTPIRRRVHPHGGLRVPHLRDGHARAG